MAKHICYVHQNMKAPKSDKIAFDPYLIRAYVAFSKTYRPMIPKNIQEMIKKYYVKRRMEYKKSLKSQDESYIYTTPRTLLAIIRLS